MITGLSYFLKTRMGTIREEGSHSLPDLPEGISLVPDYGYYDWLSVPAFQQLLQAFNFQIIPVTA
jgi:hypothetical protein